MTDHDTPPRNKATGWSIICLLLILLSAFLAWEAYVKENWREMARHLPSHAYIGEDKEGREILEYTDEPFAATRVDFKQAEASVFSQSGEDGVLQKIFELIEPSNKYAVEFGGGDGVKNSNVRNLIINKGWSCLLIEGDEELSAQSARNYAGYPKATSLHKWVYPGNLETIFEDHQLPRDLDLLVIDIDSNDYWCWKAMHRFRPKVVMIECNGIWAPPVRFVVDYSPFNYWDYSNFYGASLQSLYELGKEKGYELLYMNQYGINAFFVDKKYFARFGIRENRPCVLYRPYMGLTYITQDLARECFDTNGHFLPIPGWTNWEKNLQPLTWSAMTVEKIVRFDPGYPLERLRSSTGSTATPTIGK